MDKKEVFWQTYLNIENALLDLSKQIYITDEILIHNKNGDFYQPCNTQLEIFSPYIADLLVRTCVEIEAISKELYFELGGEKSRGDSSILFDEDCLKQIDIKCQTHLKQVLVVSPFFNLSKDENKVLKPLKEAHKRKGTDWERAYQAVKHDRYYSLSKATIKILIHALAALYLLNIYFRDIKLSSTFNEFRQLDMSLGSKLFSLPLPQENYLIEAINGIKTTESLHSSNSPYVLKYTDAIYKQIMDADEQANKKRTDFCMSQPELRDPSFIDYIKIASEQANNAGQRFILLNEIYKYRINKKIPAVLPFETRKQLLLNSDEWRELIRNNQCFINPDEITEDNIQAEIDRIASLLGTRFDFALMKPKLDKGIKEGYCELVLDKGDVRYKL